MNGRDEMSKPMKRSAFSLNHEGINPSMMLESQLSDIAEAGKNGR